MCLCVLYLSILYLSMLRLMQRGVGKGLDQYKAPPPYNSDGRVNSNGCPPLRGDAHPCNAVARGSRRKLASRSRFRKANTSEV